MDVNGNEVESDELNIKFETSTVAPVTFPDQTCVFMPTIATEGAFILVDMGDIFTSLTAEEADAVSGRTYDAVTWYTRLILRPLQQNLLWKKAVCMQSMKMLT